jgi:carbamoylphosphate synthase large subunit
MKINLHKELSEKEKKVQIIEMFKTLISNIKTSDSIVSATFNVLADIEKYPNEDGAYMQNRDTGWRDVNIQLQFHVKGKQ